MITIRTNCAHKKTWMTSAGAAATRSGDSADEAQGTEQ